MDDIKRIACEEVGVGENGRVELFRFSFLVLPLLPSPSAPFTHKIQQQSCGSYTNFCFFFLLHSSRDRLWSRNVAADWCSSYDVTGFCREEGEMSSVRCL